MMNCVYITCNKNVLYINKLNAPHLLFACLGLVGDCHNLSSWCGFNPHTSGNAGVCFNVTLAVEQGTQP